MSVELSEIKNLKVVPKNYESGTVCEIEKEEKGEVKINLPFLNEIEQKDYSKNEQVEFFGIHKNGLAYFKSEILDKYNKTIIIKKPELIKEIQRRKYSRVPYDGKLILSGKTDINVLPEDISAGGVRFYSNKPLMVGDEFDIKIELSNNLVVNCSIQPIRVEEIEEETNLSYSISAKFKKIRSIDRIALMQYSLRFLSEMQNKG